MTARKADHDEHERRGGCERERDVHFRPFQPPPTYAVTFAETGLTAGTNWSVALNQTTEYAAAPSTIAFLEPNGTYSYVAPPVGIYWPYREAGSLEVKGSEVNVSLTFASTATLVFVVVGLPSGQDWELNVTNSTIGYVFDTFVDRPYFFMAAFVNTTFGYSATFFGNYSGADTRGNVTVGDEDLLVMLTATAKGGSASSPAFPWIWVGVAATVLAAGAIAAFATARRHRPPSISNRSPPPVHP